MLTCRYCKKCVIRKLMPVIDFVLRLGWRCESKYCPHCGEMLIWKKYKNMEELI